jgi:Protein of unknown function (DUF2971)
MLGGTQLVDAEDQYAKLFFRMAHEQMTRARRDDFRLVHYTTSETAMQILRNKEFWMRATPTMNDFTEVQHGAQCLASAYKSAAGRQLQATLDGLYPGFVQQLETHFNGWMPEFERGTYIACFSEHLQSEDQLGRLSMWRAYGRAGGVALVLRNTPFIAVTDALRAYTSPVAYLNSSEFLAEFEKTAKGIVEAEDYLRELGKDTVFNAIFEMFRFAAVGTKHPGFKEELEWRIVHTPAYQPSEKLVRSVVSVGGVPQVVMKIPLRNVPDEGLSGIEIPEIIERVIIGPTEHAHIVAEAISELLAEAGLKEAGSKVVVSEIPLR